MAASGLILIVGKKLTDHETLQNAVQSFGFPVACADNTDEGVASVRADRPSLIIYDQELVDVGDQDFAGALDRCGLKECPLIAMPSILDGSAIAHALLSGADDIIALDDTMDALLDRVAFWMVSGFTELPMELRRRAGENMDNIDSFLMKKGVMRLRQSVVQNVSETLRAEIAQLDTAYGGRKMEKICFLGRLSKLVLERSTSAIDYMRFPDYCVHIVRGLKNPQLSEMAVLFKRFEAWSCDPRFVFSGVEALRPMSEYEWYNSDYGDEV